MAPAAGLHRQGMLVDANGYLDCEIRALGVSSAMVLLPWARSLESHVYFWERSAPSVRACKVCGQSGALVWLQFTPREEDLRFADLD